MTAHISQCTFAAAHLLTAALSGPPACLRLCAADVAYTVRLLPFFLSLLSLSSAAASDPCSMCAISASAMSGVIIHVQSQPTTLQCLCQGFMQELAMRHDVILSKGGIAHMNA